MTDSGFRGLPPTTDDLLPNLADRRPPRRTWLRENFENRTIAEMSIGFWIAAVSSFFLAVGCVAKSWNWIESRSGSTKTVVVLGALVLWLGFLAWLWISLVRIARGWGPERLGLFIFKFLRMGLIVLTVAVGLPVSWDDLRIFSFVFLAFDSVLVGMVMVFVPLAWSARCRIPWRGYREILIIAALFVVQTILWVHRSHH
ncbi:MAG: hypothetical protein ACM3VT_01185 [Solirubrobacterales bacterium]